MEVKVQAWGNSKGIRLPVKALRQFNLAVGDFMTMVITESGIELRPVVKTPTYSLEALISECDLSADEPVGMAVWADRTAGRRA